MRQCSDELSLHSSWRRSAVRIIILCTIALTGCRETLSSPTATSAAAGVLAATVTPTETQQAPVVTVAPATPSPAVRPGDVAGWARYTNASHGFAFTFPASWSLVETAAREDEPSSIWLRWQMFRLQIEYKPAGDPAPLQGYGSARNWREAGSVPTMGLTAVRELLRVEGKTKRVTYRVERRPLEVGGLVLGITLRSAAADECLGAFDLDCDYASVDLPEALQAEADRIVKSFELIAPAPVADDPHPGWNAFARADYGITLRYPRDWVLSEGRNYVALTRGATRLVIGYGWETEEVNVCCTLGPDLAQVREAGSVEFLGHDLGKGALVEGEVVKAVVYNGADRFLVDGRAFVAYVEGSAADPDSAGIPRRLQAQADAVLASIVLYEPATSLREPAAIPTQEPVAPTPDPIAPADAAIVGGETGGNIRSGPGTLHEIVGFLDPGQEARVVGRYRDWWKIQFGTEVAWVANKVVIEENTEGVPDVEPGDPVRLTPDPQEGPVLVVGPNKLNVRSGPGTSYLRVGSLDPGAHARIVGRNGDWWQITFDGDQGWVSGQFASAFNTETVPDVDAPTTAVSSSPDVIPPPARPSEITEDRWIDLDLSEQRVTVYENSRPIYQTLVSTGLPNTPTPTGQFRIWIKLRYDDMSGTDYYLEDVPYVMYFYQGYGFHGVWWHGNFGSPMSHGCVNLPNGADEWLFNWADVGTLVNVHD